MLNRRLTLLQGIVLALLSILLLRLTYVQIGAGAEHLPAGHATPTATVLRPGLRGSILDRSGRPLMTDQGRVVVTVDHNVVEKPDSHPRADVLARLARVLGTDPAHLRAGIVPCGAAGAEPPSDCWNGSPLTPVPVAWDVGAETILALAERRELFPGVAVELRAARHAPQPYGMNAAHVLGYLGVDGGGMTGRSGLERIYDEQLRGRPGNRTVAVDARGRGAAVVREEPPRRGMDLVTSLDARIQAVVEEELRSAMRRARRNRHPGTGRRYAADTGAAIVMEVQTGRVVALAAEPDYRPNLWSDGLNGPERESLFGDEKAAPLYFRAIQGEYAPGSIFKPVTVAAALRHGTSPSSTLPCPGTLSIGGRTFRNFDSTGHGSLTFGEALAMSCDTFFYRVGVDLWRRGGEAADPLADTAAGFGFGRRTGIDLPGEAAGRLPDRPPYPGVAALIAIGQADLTVTPIQVAVAYAAIANGGTLWEPKVGEAVVGPSGTRVRTITPERAGRLPLSPPEIALLSRALRRTTRSGTAAGPFAGFPLDTYPVAAKTGTAEVAGRQPTSWFASFDDRYVVVMMVTRGGTGAGTSGPSVRRIWEALYGMGGSR